jgi:hypothetical protein
MPSEVDDNDLNAMPIYESRPPAWLPKTHGSADLGMCNSRPSYEEMLNRDVVKDTLAFILHVPGKMKMSCRQQA